MILGSVAGRTPKHDGDSLSITTVPGVFKMQEITFVVMEDDIDGGYTARSHWPEGNRDLFTEGDTREELVRNIREAVDLTFDNEAAKPDLIHLHFVRDEVIAR